MAITWTKLWLGTDDGTLLKGVDLKNFQQDMANVLTTSDVGSSAEIITHDGEILVYEGQVLYE